MKKQTENTLAAISNEQHKKLTTVANETLATELMQSKTFSTVDLWNIQRRVKTMLDRRHFA